MVIKKHHSRKHQNINVRKRLEAYAQQGRSYRKTRHGRAGGNSVLLKSSLAAIIPLAAAGALQAQQGCLGPLNGGANVMLVASYTTTYPASAGSYTTYRKRYHAKLGIDVDGVPGNDFVIHHFSGKQYYAGAQVYTTSRYFQAEPAAGHYLRGVASGMRALNVTGTVQRGQNSFGQNNNRMRFLTQSGGTFGYFPENNVGYIAIRKGNETDGAPGWIKIEIVSLQNKQFILHDRGYEHPSNTPGNSAVVDNCASMAASLPVEMTHFRTAPQGKHIQLEWATASELNNEGFEVQRSTDGRSFAKVGWVSGQGTTNEEQTYRFLDDEVQPNVKYYYRLKQVDTDGTAELSPVRSAMVEDASVVQVSELFPNPVGKGRGLARFRLQAPAGGEAVIHLFDARGALVKELNREYAAGQNTLAVPIHHLEAGQYFVKMQLGQEVLYRKLVVN